MPPPKKLAVRDRDRVDRGLDAIVALPSNMSCTRWFLYDHVARAVANMNDSRPSFLPLSLTSRSTTPDTPNDAMFANIRWPLAALARRQLELADVDLPACGSP